MKKITFLLASLLVTGFSAFAQLPYTVTTLTQTYTSLTGGTSINAGALWDEESYKIALPFSYKIGGATVNSLNLLTSFGGIATDTTGTISGFSFGDMDLEDRGYLTGGASLSPITYTVTGTSPNRVLKVQLANAGFYDEINDNNTSNDFVNLQVWIFETSSVVELHFGPSTVSTPDYFSFSDGPAVGYVKNLNINAFTFDKFYTLAGNPAAPTADSVDLATFSGSGLNAYPANGTVYRYTPKATTGVSTIPAFASINVYPTITTGTLNVAFNEQNTASYEIISMDGRSMGIVGNLHNGINKLDVNTLATGMYILRVENSNNRGIYRFTKK